MRIAAIPSNVKSAATILSESEDQHGPGCCRIGMMTAERIPLSSVDRNPADLAGRAATAGELRSFGRRRTDGGTHQSNRVTPHTCLALAGRPSPGCRGRARWFYSSSLVC